MKEDLKLCKACLVIDVKMFPIHVSSISTAYTELTGISDLEPNQYMCFECVALLRKCQDFRSKCFRAHKLLVNYSITRGKLHKSRKENQLESPLHVTTSKSVIIKPRVLDENNIISVDDIKSETTLLNNVKTEDVVQHLEINDTLEAQDTYDGQDTFQSNDHTKITERSRELKADTSPKRNKINNIRDNTINVNKICSGHFEDDDNEPLSKMSTKRHYLKETKRTAGPKFDASCFNEFATVILLTPEDAKREVELRKESTNYINCPHKCSLCYRGFEKQKAYENHMRKHSTDFGEHECPYCHLRFPKQEKYCKHIFSCHKRKFCCNICSYVCFCPYQAKLHINLHKGKKYTCVQCGDIFSMPNTLLMHKRIKHPTECVCALCGSTFVTQRGLSSHRQLLHRQEENPERGPACAECGVHFASDVAWRRHLVLSAKHFVSHGCETCGETFADDESLKTHSRAHSRRQRSRRESDAVQLSAGCALCGERVATRAQYWQHVTSAHPQSAAARRHRADTDLRCVCELCGKRFKKPCFLVYHQRVHTGERPYACAECGKTFALPGSLSAHRRRHRSASRLPCDRCDKTFRSKSALTKHVRVCHLQLKPWSCSACTKTFPSRCQLLLHTRHVHHRVPWPRRARLPRAPPALGARDGLS